MKQLILMLTMGMLVAGAGAVSGQDYPNKTIRVITGSAGGGGDVVSRQVAAGIAGPLGQPVIVENRAAVIAVDTVAKAPPDGYTLLIQGGTVWTRPLLEKTSWDAVRDFSPISRLVNEINTLAVHPSLPVKTVSQLITLAKARPGELNYASSGVGTTNHLAMELFKSMAGISIVHIPHRSGPSIMALIAGDVQVLITDAGLLAPHVKAGKLRHLAVASAEPSALAPGLPTIAAAGVPGYELVSTTGLFAPAKTSEAIIARLSQEARRVLGRPEVKERFLSAGAEVVGSSPEQFAATIKSEIARMGKVIKDAGIKME
jgi:tripartite-type tricarboxylate transporter receptor subunit TctC